MRIIEYFLEGQELDFAKQDVIESTGLGRATVYRDFRLLLQRKVLKQSRKVANTKLFTLNKENIVASELITFYNNLIKQSLNAVAAENASLGKEVR
jgi:Fe2+ or Zn2+ uptake regulation protein